MDEKGNLSSNIGSSIFHKKTENPNSFNGTNLFENNEEIQISSK